MMLMMRARSHLNTIMDHKHDDDMMLVFIAKHGSCLKKRGLGVCILLVMT